MMFYFPKIAKCSLKKTIKQTYEAFGNYVKAIKISSTHYQTAFSSEVQEGIELVKKAQHDILADGISRKSWEMLTKAYMLITTNYPKLVRYSREDRAFGIAVRYLEHTIAKIAIENMYWKERK